MPYLDDEYYMQAALEQAKQAESRDEVPVGAVLVDINTGNIVAANGNRTIELSDPTAHAEILVIRELCDQVEAQRIPEYDLFVTLEPCTMCATAISFARLRRLVFGTPDKKGGAVVSGVKFFDQSSCHHKIDVTHDVCAQECSEILKSYFKKKRQK